MASDYNDLAQAAVRAFHRPLEMAQGHQNIDVGGVWSCLLHLRRRREQQGIADIFTKESLDQFFCEVRDGTSDVAGFGPERTAVVQAHLERLFRFFVPDGSTVRLSRRADLTNPAMYGACDMVSAPEEQARRMLASNYLLVFPESFAVLRTFAPPGGTKANARRLASQFRFCRKLNDVNVSLCVDELETLGTIRQTGSGLITVAPIPTSGAAFFIIEAALETTNYHLDVQIPTALLLQQLVDRLPKPDALVERNDLQIALGAPEPVLRRELQGAQVRLTRSSFVWMVERGVVDPLAVGHVLREAEDHDAVRTLANGIMKKVQSLDPGNLDDYAHVFAEN